MGPAERAQGRERRAYIRRIAVTHAFTIEELQSIFPDEEPSTAQIRRWIGNVVNRAVNDARRRAEEENRPEDPDIRF